MRALLPTEHEEQVALVQWAAYVPELRWLHAIPNAGAGAQRGQAGKMKAEGAKPGVPDLSLPLPIGRFHGAYVEMKRQKGGRVSPEQAEWHDYLKGRGYAVLVAAGFEPAREFLSAYIAGSV